MTESGWGQVFRGKAVQFLAEVMESADLAASSGRWELWVIDAGMRAGLRKVRLSDCQVARRGSGSRPLIGSAAGKCWLRNCSTWNNSAGSVFGRSVADSGVPLRSWGCDEVDHKIEGPRICRSKISRDIGFSEISSLAKLFHVEQSRFFSPPERAIQNSPVPPAPGSGSRRPFRSRAVSTVRDPQNRPIGQGAGFDGRRWRDRGLPPATLRVEP